MRFVTWRFRRADTPPGLRCRHCAAELATCPRCLGRWDGRACDCGIGWCCPECGPHWA